MTEPMVRVVVINYDGGDMTVLALDSLRAVDYPRDRIEIVLVDNASVDGLIDRLRRERDDLVIIESLDNTGFAGGCNLGISYPGRYDYVALFNNDAVADPGWLRPLVSALESDPMLGAACSKILFSDRYWGMQIDAPARVSGALVDGADAWHDVKWDEGVGGPEAGSPDEPVWRRVRKPTDVRWVSAPDETTPARVALRLSADEPRTATVSTGIDGETRDVALGPQPQWVELRLPPEPHDVINNVGSNLFAGGFGGDRGYLERDQGQYHEPAEVFAWCGGAVLLRPSYLQHVGLFDERFFLYYEDTDLSWRGRQLGWRYSYVPGSVVRHLHSASSGEGSDVFRFHVERNRLLLLVKNAPARLAARAAAIEARAAARQVVAEYVRPMARARRPRPMYAPQKLQSQCSFLRLLPSMVMERRRLRRTRSIGDAELARWTVTK